jgi:hypothetical protein
MAGIAEKLSVTALSDSEGVCIRGTPRSWPRGQHPHVFAQPSIQMLYWPSNCIATYYYE